MRQRVIRVSIAICAVMSVMSVMSPTAPATAQTDLQVSCVTIFNQEVPRVLELGPGEVVQFTKAPGCPVLTNFLFGIRAAGARTGSSPATRGVVEYTDDGTTWNPVALQQSGWSIPVSVRYTAPLDAGDDSFYVVAADAGAGNGGYLYSVTVAPESTSGPERDGTVWQQALQRSTSDAPCPDGYGGSWAQWPNAGTGGWVCVRNVWAFDPEGRAGPA